MTSTLNETILKVKTALDNVFVKKTDIKNNLVSTDIDKPLSANQGKELNDNKVDKISGKGLSKNDFTDTYKGKLDDLDTNLNNKANATHNHGNLQSDGSVGTSDNASKNVITDGNGKITTEDKIVASDTKPSADTSSGNKGSSTDYARADHVHPKSTIYAASTHSHTTLANMTSIYGNFVSTQQKPIFNIPTQGQWKLIDGKISYNGSIITYNNYELATKNDIPDSISDLTNDSNFIETSETSGLIKNDGTIDTSAYITSNSLPTKTSDLINDGFDGTNIYVSNNDNRLSDSRNPIFTEIYADTDNRVDLDNYCNGGFYFSPNNQYTKFILNCPNSIGSDLTEDLPKSANHAFFLLVENWGTITVYAKQTLTYYDTNKTYTRIRVNRDWGEWKQVANIDDVTSKADSSHTHGNLSNDGKVSTTSSANMLYFCGVGASANTLYKSNKLSSDVLIDGTAHSNIGSAANESQSSINSKIDSLIGQAITYINQ